MSLCGHGAASIAPTKRVGLTRKRMTPLADIQAVRNLHDQRQSQGHGPEALRAFPRPKAVEGDVWPEVCRRRRYIRPENDRDCDYRERHAEAYRNGERISTAHVECTVNQLINWRMCKKKQMGWSRTGAQYLLYVKTAIINGRLDRYSGHHSVPADIAA